MSGGDAQQPDAPQAPPLSSIPELEGAGATVRAPRVILFVPGLSPREGRDVDAVAASLAAEADRRGGRFSTRTAPAAPPGLRSGRTIVQDGHAVVDLYEVDYRATFLDLDRGRGRKDSLPGLLTSLYCALRSAVLWFRALTTFGRGTKGTRSVLHLLLGLGVVAVLALVVTVVAVAAAVALVEQVTDTGLPLPAWVPRLQADLVVVLGVVTGAGLLAVRTRVLVTAGQFRRVLRYYDDAGRRRVLVDEVVSGVDGVLDEGLYPGGLHLLAYSFGATLVLDGLLSEEGEQPHPQMAAVQSLTTLGCPYDLERLFFPQRYDGRQPAAPRLEWRNVFVASDLFGSNFHTADDRTTGTCPGPGGLQVTSSRHLPAEELSFWSLLRFAAFRHHADYWYGKGGCWAPVLGLWGLAPADLAVPAQRLSQEQSPSGRRAPAAAAADEAATAWSVTTGAQGGVLQLVALASTLLLLVRWSARRDGSRATTSAP